MARLWIVRREGLRLVGAPVAEIPLERAVPGLDLAPWRLFTREAPDSVPAAELSTGPDRKRVLVEVGEADRGDLCGLVEGFFESPFSPPEALRRLGIEERAAAS